MLLAGGAIAIRGDSMRSVTGHEAIDRTATRDDELLCACQLPGFVNTGIKGTLAGLPHKRGQRIIERCGTCLLFMPDEVAGREYASRVGGVSSLNADGEVVWEPK